MPKKQTEWSRAYNEKAYDRLAITIPKGQKAALQAFAENHGESINSFVNRAILAQMGLDEWPEKEDSDAE